MGRCRSGIPPLHTVLQTATTPTSLTRQDAASTSAHGQPAIPSGRNWRAEVAAYTRSAGGKSRVFRASGGESDGHGESIKDKGLEGAEGRLFGGIAGRIIKGVSAFRA